MVVQGTGHEALKEGPGHYPDTADPWDEQGRVGIAGHRTTYLHPFFKLNELTPGDTITLRTVYGIYRYEVRDVDLREPDEEPDLPAPSGPDERGHRPRRSDRRAVRPSASATPTRSCRAACS